MDRHEQVESYIEESEIRDTLEYWVNLTSNALLNLMLNELYCSDLNWLDGKGTQCAEQK